MCEWADRSMGGLWGASEQRRRRPVWWSSQWSDRVAQRGWIRMTARDCSRRVCCYVCTVCLHSTALFVCCTRSLCSQRIFSSLRSDPTSQPGVPKTNNERKRTRRWSWRRRSEWCTRREELVVEGGEGGTGGCKQWKGRDSVQRQGERNSGRGSWLWHRPARRCRVLNRTRVWEVMVTSSRMRGCGERSAARVAVVWTISAVGRRKEEEGRGQRRGRDAAPRMADECMAEADCGGVACGLRNTAGCH